MTTNDAVNFPAHYTNGDVESIDAIWASGHGVGFCIGNAQKYLYRAGKKGEDSLQQDVEKASWYLRFLLSKLDSKHPDPRESRAKKSRDGCVVLRVAVDRRSYAAAVEALRGDVNTVELDRVGCGYGQLTLKDGDHSASYLTEAARDHFEVLGVL